MYTDYLWCFFIVYLYKSLNNLCLHIYFYYKYVHTCVCTYVLFLFTFAHERDKETSLYLWGVAIILPKIWDSCNRSLPSGFDLNLGHPQSLNVPMCYVIGWTSKGSIDRSIPSRVYPKFWTPVWFLSIPLCWSFFVIIILLM